MIPIAPYALYLCAALAVTNTISLALWRAEAHKLTVLELKGEIAAERTQATIKEQKQITEDTTNGWKAALDTTHTAYRQRLQRSGVQPMPPVSGPAGGVDGLAPDALALAAQCAETTVTLEKFQAWAREQKAANR